MNQAASEAQPSQRSTEFVPFSGNPQETSSAGGLLATAYVLMWAAVFAFLFASWRRQQRIDARLDELNRALAKTGPGER